MKWIKKCLIFKADDIKSDFIKSHAQIPTVLVLEDRFRVYFATRPKPGLSMTTYMDLDIKDPKKILYIHDQPIFELGKDGMYDEHGVMPQSIVKYDDKVCMYIGGWSRRESIPYSNWTGLAESYDEGKTFKKVFEGPVFDRTPVELYSATGFYAMKAKNMLHAFYASGMGWIKKNNKYEEIYVIKTATSKDGVNWCRDGKQIIPTPKKCFQATHRPSVIYKNDIYHMWFCYRGVEDFRNGRDAYRIGYAWSKDLKNWNRDDERAGINISKEGWDSKMMAYPHVVETLYGTYMFYNGNGFGQSGFGYAVLEE
ncbi:hypothetical protein [Francisella orientalis]|uniref:Glycosylase n=1 Tax=Francisella orientalis TaxID=299583 RepID=A0AAW9YP79_9GAMM|nr:hypothetical protein [Francisella orientalis]AFJ43299.1 hypothetical protein OOM_0820 [Francisella orientalis str. Toba 04]AHB98772.1 hypothetical protein M973_08210 [Francisella orientalis LADL 07-285A]AKN86034.1 hypothetical protein FNO12_1481 [Francisella orientalis FNO12]AKN87572.1 Hypothetical protein FNO24_1483 [Francisella orientalis FNO24]AKN89110.1 Hypothetical protein FNO190_1481 [Francisella orientalis]